MNLQPMSLNERQQRVLQAAVRHYIATAEPVGSKALVEEYDFAVSPATIRSCLGFLEKAGLLYQPHTSAGRVPSDSGYRIYVDQLITPNETTARRAEKLLRDKLNWQNWSLEALFRGAAQILAQLSGYITLITMPQRITQRLQHVQLVQVDPGRVMMVIVTDTYETQSVLVELPKLPEQEELDIELIDRELQILSNFLNTQLRSRSFSEIATLDWQELDQEFTRYVDIIAVLLAEITHQAQSPTATQVWVSGVAEVLRLPEFSQLQQVQTLFQLLEEEPLQLLPSMYLDHQLESDNPRRVQLWIGSENPLEPMRTCAIVTANYSKGSIPIGRIGVLGPTRMVYENAIAVVEATADYLSDALS